MSGEFRAPRRGRRRAAGLMCALLCFAAAVASQMGADRTRHRGRGDDVLYLPNEKLLRHATAGLNTIIADFLWLHCIQYVAIENRSTRSFTWLETMVRTTVRLDPHFRDAYRYGSIFLAALKADAEASERLLKIGIPQNPRAWELPYELGMGYLMNRRDEPDAKRYAAYYLGMSAATGTSPPFVVETAVKLQSDYNIETIEGDMWQEMLQNPDKMIRGVAERKLKEMQVRQVQSLLQQAAAYYHEKTGRWPESVDDLKNAGMLRQDPPDPLGGRYFFGPEGKVYSTTLLDNQKRSALGKLELAVGLFHEDKGYWPESFDVLLKEGLLKEVPPHPYPGQSWKYDPATGKVE